MALTSIEDIKHKLDLV